MAQWTSKVSKNENGWYCKMCATKHSVKHLSSLFWKMNDAWNFLVALLHILVCKEISVNNRRKLSSALLCCLWNLWMLLKRHLQTQGYSSHSPKLAKSCCMHNKGKLNMALFFPLGILGFFGKGKLLRKWHESAQSQILPPFLNYVLVSSP